MIFPFRKQISRLERKPIRQQIGLATIEHRAQEQNEGEFCLAVFYPRLRVISVAEKVEKCITDFIPYIHAASKRS